MDYGCRRTTRLRYSRITAAAITQPISARIHHDLSLFLSFRCCSCLASGPSGKVCHFPKAKYAFNMNLKITTRMAKPITISRYTRPAVSDVALIISKYAAIRYGTFAGPATARRNSCQYFGGQISSPQIAQRPYHTSSRKLSSPRQKRVLHWECCHPSRQECDDVPCLSPFCRKLRTACRQCRPTFGGVFSFGLDLLKMEVSSLAGLILNK